MKQVKDMKQFWTWGGKYAGVQQGDYLVTCSGTVLGKFYGHEIYNQDGDYIGETGRNDRLFKNVTKTGQRRPVFSYGIRGTISACSRDVAPYPLIGQQEDFVAVAE